MGYNYYMYHSVGKCSVQYWLSLPSTPAFIRKENVDLKLMYIAKINVHDDFSHKVFDNYSSYV